MTGRLKNEAGFALILTLVVTALMVAVVVEMIHQVYVDTSLSRGFRDGQQASILAESGVMAVNKALSQKIDPTLLSGFLAKPLSDEAGSLEIKITEESGKINVNDVAVLKKMDALKLLGTRLKLPGEIWSAVADWIDIDDIQISGGAESAYYRTLKPPYSARNSKLMTLTELSLVKGITPEIFGKLQPYLTTFSEEANSPQSLININTASKEVLQALDGSIDDRTAERIMEQRRIKAFESIGDVNTRVPGTGPGLGGAMICYKGNVFRITSVARVKDSARTVEAVVRLSGEVLSWQEY
jgi:general secretion pathway protein K